MKLIIVGGCIATVVALGSAGLTQGRLSSAHHLATEWSPSEKPGLGPNLLANGSFSRSDSWMLEIGPRPANGDLKWVDAAAELPGLTGRIARCEVLALGEQPWHVQFCQNGVDLADGEVYTLTFWARADRDRPLRITGIIDRPDWHGIGLNKSVQLTPGWRKFTLRFTPENAARHHGRLSFLVGEVLGTVELADVALQRDPEASAVRTPYPLVGTWEGRDGSPGDLRFTLNADGTGSMTRASAAPSVPPRAPVSNPFRWYLKGEQLVLSSRAYAWSLEQEGEGHRLTLQAGGKRSVLYRVEQ